jgi:hypothetical protein
LALGSRESEVPDGGRTRVACVCLETQSDGSRAAHGSNVKVWCFLSFSRVPSSAARRQQASLRPGRLEENLLIFKSEPNPQVHDAIHETIMMMMKTQLVALIFI